MGANELILVDCQETRNYNHNLTLRKVFNIKPPQTYIVAILQGPDSLEGSENIDGSTTGWYVKGVLGVRPHGNVNLKSCQR